MGHRTLKRVPMDFNAQLDEVWKGYINPYPGPLTCNLCNGSGYNTATNQIAEDFYDHDGFGNRWRYDYGVAPDGSLAEHPPWRIVGESLAWCDKITQDEVQALVDAGRLMDFTHTWTRAEGWKPKRWETKGFWCPQCRTSVPQLSSEHHSGLCTECNKEMELLEGDDSRLHTPTAEEVNAYERQGGINGHDAINRGILIEARAKRLGVYEKCPVCEGNGELPHPNEAIRKLHEEWQEFEPPSGDGFQLWETCSKGSPVSPVFASAEELASWCEENATIFADMKTSKENWLKMFSEEDGVDSGSLLIGTSDGYLGAAINLPEEPKDTIQ